MAVYRLALFLGKTVEELLHGKPSMYLEIPLGTWFGKPRALRLKIDSGCRGMTTSQLKGWMAYHSVEPFGEYRSELRHGQMMSLVANIHRDSKEHPEPFPASEFMNFLNRPKPKELTPEQLAAKMDRELFKIG